MEKTEATVDNTPFAGHVAPELLVLDKGEGAWLYDKAGNKYLDFGSGIAVNALGYGREDMAQVVYNQMKKLIHIPPLWTTEPALELGKKLVASGPFAAVHLGNSGSEANEAALKFARLYAKRAKGEEHHKILCFENAFHGRTMGALSCTPTPKYQDPYQPLVPGVLSVPYNDVAALKAVLNAEFAAVIVEVVQGEGGMTCMTQEFAGELGALCRKHDIILIADEIQTGLYRTGSLYASLEIGLEPDILTLAKPLAGGLPLSATLLAEKVNKLIHVGEHGTTFGGGPVTTALGLFVWDKLNEPAFLAELKEKINYLDELLQKLQLDCACVGRLKGKGFLRGIEILDTKGKGEKLMPDLLEEAQAQGILVLRSGKNILRIAPSFIISRQELSFGVELLHKVLKEIE
ncbi:MAG: aspartate aminotransferase family protein [Spirochaetales bacterium]|nr:aspartate aminotransferase family protein [Spirochaetales bacterium]